MSDIHRLVLPNRGPGGRRRVALGATVAIGDTSLRFYSVHSESRMSTNGKIEQLKAVLGDLAEYPKAQRAIVLGDFNTWQSQAVKKTSRLFAAAGFSTPFNNEPTFVRKILFIVVDFKLDWIWLRGVSANSHGIDRQTTLSDHYPLWVEVSLKPGV